MIVTAATGLGTQLAKCDAFSKGKELYELEYWVMKCNTSDLRKEIDDLGRLIWLGLTDCLTVDQACSVRKKLNSKRFTKIVCDPDTSTPCSGNFDCSQINVEVLDPEECSLPITSV